MSPPPPPSSSSSLPSESAAPAVARLVAAAAAAGGHDADADADAAAASAEAYERTHVHGVYEAIAPHFSSTRYKPWPAVAQFLHAQRPGSVGLDVGCGNGKYLGVNPGVFMVGSDWSGNLVSLARSRCQQQHSEGGGVAGEDGAHAQGSKKKKNKKQHQHQGAAGEVAVTVNSSNNNTGPVGSEVDRKGSVAAATDVLVADGLSLPFRDRSADFAICVAVIHHMSTRARRQDAIRQLLKCVRPAGGKALSGPDDVGREGTVLVYVWALEQGSSRRGWDEGGEQDLLVPWVMKKHQSQPKAGRPGPGPGHGPEGKAVVAGTDTANDNSSGEQQQQDQHQLSADTVTTAMGAGGGVGGGPGGENDPTDNNPNAESVFQRYYHLYRKGELEEDVLAAGGVVVTSGYERDNWWVVTANALPSRPI
ncbi:hypothetical protein B0H66DRAFT_340761 [Apodospora peruviana]|uniref:Methyltransferase type 11 domain-containing protein n=1 Tax=Apodospora peruviana TaxID=516989 RepID=A0AAE0M286_9PEZI|nr:hypothetical protein B0H66DRAFT_340761 [Apodospora peruviana]